MRRVPLDLLPCREKGIFLIQHADEPLLGHDVFHRGIVALMDADGLSDLLRAQHQSGRTQCLHGGDSRLRHGKTCKRTGQLRHASVAIDRLLQGKVMRTPPLDVGGVAEGAAHDRARTLLRIGACVLQHRYVEVEEGHAHPFSDQFFEARVAGVDEYGDTGGKQFRPSGGDRKVLAVRPPKREGDELTLTFQIVHLGLRNRGVAGGTPDRRRALSVGTSPLREVEKRALRGPSRFVVDRAIRAAPVDRQTQPPPQCLIPALDLGADLQALLNKRGASQLLGGKAELPLHQSLGR